MKTNMVLFGAVMGLLLACSAGAQELDKFSAQQQVRVPKTVPALMAIAARFRTEKRWEDYTEALVQLVALRPFDVDFRFRLAGAYAIQDEKTLAYDQLVKLMNGGLTYDIAKDSDFDNLRGFGLWDYLTEGFAASAEPRGSGVLAFQSDDKQLIVDGMAADQTSGTFFYASVRQGKIFRVTSAGESSLFFDSADHKQVSAIFGLAVDVPRGLLWATTNPSAMYEGERGSAKTALIAIDLSTGKIKRMAEPPIRETTQLLGNIAVSGDGVVFVADSNAPVVYVYRQELESLAPLMSMTDMTSLRGLALGNDDRFLYVADHAMGLAVIDLENQNAPRLQFATTVELAGIDGLYIQGKRLVIIQGDSAPQRVTQLNLGDDWLNIISIHVLASNLEHMDAPTSGAILGEEFRFAANSQWYDFASDGTLRKGLEATVTTFLATPLKPEGLAEPPEESKGSATTAEKPAEG